MEAKRLEVPDFPYTKQFTHDRGSLHRIAISPLEWDGAKEAIQHFWNSLSPQMQQHGIDRMALHDEQDLLMTWDHVTLFVTETPYGFSLEIETLEKDIAYVV